jgi:hypothetical protein
VSEESAPPPGDVDVASRPPSRSDVALARYRTRMRRSRAVYYTTVAAIVAALGSWAGITWARGEAAHASLHTFPSPPPTLGVHAPSAQQQQIWHADRRIALGVPQYGGTVITYSAHSVGGLSVRTGRPTWTYTRTDRPVCTAAQVGGTTIAVYANRGNCDEVSAFASDTGRRQWTRTLDSDGMPMNGHPGFQVTATMFLAWSPSVIYAIDPTNGYGGWTYQRYGCRIEHVVLGSGGALISQDCGAVVRCKGVKFCGRGPQLLLRDPTAGRGDSSKPNADQIKWNRFGDTDLPVSADDVISSLDPRGNVLYVHDPNTGARTHRVALTNATTSSGPPSATATDAAELVWVAGVLYAIPPDSSTPQWTADAGSPPVVMSPAGDSSITLSSARITVPTSTGVALLDGANGNTVRDVSVPGVSAGSLVYSAGTGFLIASPSGITAYR